MTFPDLKIWKCHFFVVSLHRILKPSSTAVVATTAVGNMTTNLVYMSKVYDY